MKKGEIWLVNLFGGTGHEQLGERPAIILAPAILQVAVVVPLTANIKALRFPFVFQIEPNKKNGLQDQSVALIFQIRAIDKGRLMNKIGELDGRELGGIDRILTKMLNLQ